MKIFKKEKLYYVIFFAFIFCYKNRIKNFNNSNNIKCFVECQIIFGVSDRIWTCMIRICSPLPHHSATDTLVDKCGKNHSCNRKEQFCNNQIPDETGCKEIKYSSNCYHETFLRQSLRERCFLSQPFRLVAKRFLRSRASNVSNLM